MQTVDFYEILHCESTATFDEIKKSYQALILKHHPDKISVHLNKLSTELAVSDNFIKITEAWNTLRDPEIRKVYDAELFQQKLCETPVVHEVLTKSEFKLDKSGEYYLYTCRCGCICEVPIEVITIERWYYNTCDECSHCVQFT